MALKINLGVAGAGWKSRRINNANIKPVQLVARTKPERKSAPNESTFPLSNAINNLFQKSACNLLLRSPSRGLPLVPLHLRVPSGFHPRLRLSDRVGQD